MLQNISLDFGLWSLAKASLKLLKVSSLPNGKNICFSVLLDLMF